MRSPRGAVNWQFGCGAVSESWTLNVEPAEICTRTLRVTAPAAGSTFNVQRSEILEPSLCCAFGPRRLMGFHFLAKRFEVGLRTKC
jgi:hypothetical protein